MRSFAPKDSPAASPGTTKAVMPRGPGSPVRAITTYTLDDPAPEMNCFTPSSTYESPSRRAVVRNAPASEPASGSVRQ
nr:hypothetical protein [Kribbella qitaiheensis]